MLFTVNGVDSAAVANETNERVEGLETTAQGIAKAGIQRRVSENYCYEMAKLCQPAGQHGTAKQLV